MHVSVTNVLPYAGNVIINLILNVTVMSIREAITCGSHS